MTDVSVSASLYHKSPLDTLARQSSRRAQGSPRLQPVSPNHHGDSRAHPSSPLLHTRFRASASTAASSFMDLRGEEDEGDIGTGREISWSRDDESVYSTTSSSSTAHDKYHFKYVVDVAGDQSPTLPPSPTPSSPSTVPEYDRQSWASHSTAATVQVHGSRQPVRDTWRSSANDVDPFAFRPYESPSAAVPKVVISSHISPMSDSSYHEPQSLKSSNADLMHTSRPRLTQYSVSNFSRPIRHPSVQNEQNKREVLERNRFPQRSTEPLRQQPEDHSSQRVHSRPQQQGHALSLPASSSTQPTHSYSGWTDSGAPRVARSVRVNAGLVALDQVPSDKERSISPNAAVGPLTERIRLPNSPPSPRPTSKVSLYSTYSFYQLDDGSRTPSPSSPQCPHPEAPNHKGASAPIDPRPRSRASRSPSRTSPPSSTPDDFLLLGIQHHEANRLVESATCFERAATIDGGCGVGMLMWGLSLRHAWGTPKDERAGFRWLRRAAEAAVGDLDAAREGRDQKAVKTELVLAIYEVGQCFFHGWGVTQDKKMAVSYFQVAARLGDCEAQQELGYCLANGKGCKKDLKEAAKWYRAAAAQGASTVGLAWIYKSKYT